MKQSILLITPNKSIYLHFYLAVYSHTPPRPLPDPLAELRHIERTDEWYIRECIETYWLPLCSKPRPPEGWRVPLHKLSRIITGLLYMCRDTLVSWHRPVVTPHHQIRDTRADTETRKLNSFKLHQVMRQFCDLYYLIIQNSEPSQATRCQKVHKINQKRDELRGGDWIC